MNKGIIMEQRRKYMVVLTKDGAFYKAMPIKGVDIGMEVIFEPFSKRKKSMLLHRKKDYSSFLSFFAFISMILFFVLPFCFITENNKVYAYVGVHLNPSIEFELNQDLNVQSIRTTTHEAEQLTKQLMNYKDQHLTDVIRRIMEKTEEAGFTNKQKHMIVGISSLQEEDANLIESIRQELYPQPSDWEITTVYVPNEIRNLAEAREISMDELMAKTIMEEEPGLYNSSNIEMNMDDKDKALIQSFYNSEINHPSSVSDDRGNKQSHSTFLE
ncbi:MULTISPECIES: anti-sigma factor domain-containing protein [unclassified Virgibacillus]|uniref:anti-sigma factor domain-containing protein n=1 Tax=unclassified Virgibacillus TaxID=2620237 RepID=UPI00090AE3DA|nr:MULTISPECIES: anti-sigma factor domain-containing protein [unclassified Virgibacillus]API91120.1 hypothetical protein BKP57_04140 [Virgibacillus sp. 6R]MBS7429109.1 anti-sigma factor domain-containing protein [Virgibacillus sp. 19R1-5]